MKIKVLFATAVALISLTAGAGTLEDVKERGDLNCGVSTGIPGFSESKDNNRWAGLDVDICRAVAAAVLGDGKQVKFIPLAAKEKIQALVDGEVDITSRQTTWTMQRDAKEGVDFTAIVYYDGQGFMVPKKLGITSAKQLDGASICVTSGTTSELNLADFAKAYEINIAPIVFEVNKEAFTAYISGRCDAFTSDASQLAGWRTTIEDSDEHILLQEIISKEPLSPVVRHGDNQWKDLVTWVIYGMIAAEEKGITSENVVEMKENSKDPTVQRMLGTAEDFGSYIGLDADWLLRAIRAVGNYGEIFERNFGANSKLKLSRGLNNLWTQDGLMYPPPIR